ncbi:MAG TPA: thioredoxin [Leucothrix mucor]|nr:thioredoxin [Leucothrix mucor]
MVNNYIFDIDLGDFEEKVITASHHKPVLVDFWADWCSPCLFIAPVLKQVLTQYQGKVLLAKLEVDEGDNMKLAGKYQVRGFPTIILFEEGQEVERFSSARPASFIEEFIESNSRLLEL